MSPDILLRDVGAALPLIGTIMRKIASLKQPKDAVRRVMLFQSDEGVYLFLYDNDQDGPATYDYWFESMEQAEQVCVEDYGISPSDWQVIPDPPPGCQHDWIRPTRIKQDSAGNLLHGQFEPCSGESENT